MMIMITFKEAVDLYLAFMNATREAQVKPEIYLHRIDAGIEFVGQADKGRARHSFGFHELVSEVDSDRLRREYSIVFKVPEAVKHTYVYL